MAGVVKRGAQARRQIDRRAVGRRRTEAIETVHRVQHRIERRAVLAAAAAILLRAPPLFFFLKVGGIQHDQAR
jgi:hypothetical protein